MAESSALPVLPSLHLADLHHGKSRMPLIPSPWLSLISKSSPASSLSMSGLVCVPPHGCGISWPGLAGLFFTRAPAWHFTQWVRPHSPLTRGRLPAGGNYTEIASKYHSAKDGTLSVIYLPWLCQPDHDCLLSPRLHLVFETNWAVLSSCLLSVFMKDSFELKEGKKRQIICKWLPSSLFFFTVVRSLLSILYLTKSLTL